MARDDAARRARSRLADERNTCASPDDIAFWEAEVMRFEEEVHDTIERDYNGTPIGESR